MPVNRLKNRWWKCIERKHNGISQWPEITILCSTCKNKYPVHYKSTVHEYNLLFPLDRNPFVVRVIPERAEVEQGGRVVLKCQVIGQAPFYYYWSRADGQPLSNRVQQRAQGNAAEAMSTMVSSIFCNTCDWGQLRKAFDICPPMLMGKSPLMGTVALVCPVITRTPVRNTEM